MATPLYAVLAEMFVPPDKIPVGSIIRTNAEPGPHLKPLNEEATLRMEEWYQKVFTFTETTYLPDGSPELKTRSHQPHMKFKINEQSLEDYEAHSVEVVRPPSADMPGALSLGETLLRHISTDPRPGPKVQAQFDISDIPPERELELVAAVPVDPKAPRRIT